MKLLTDSQRTFLSTKKIKVDGLYMFPRYGFTIYPNPSYVGGEFLSTNPFTKSLDKEHFLVKKIENGFCKGNFHHKPKGADFYLSESELAHRDGVERLFLYIFTYVPMAIYNLFRPKAQAPRQ